MTLREKIADTLSDLLGGDHYTTFPEDAADAILKIPEIQDARDALDRKVTICPNCGYSPL